MKNAAGEAGRVYTNDQVMQAQRNYDERKAQLEYLQKSSAVGIQSAAEHQALALQQSAEYVEDQILEVPSKRSSLRLSPVGTNLYVRTYVDPKKAKAPPAELLADQDRLLLVATHNKQGELTADQDKLLLRTCRHSQ